MSVLTQFHFQLTDEFPLRKFILSLLVFILSIGVGNAQHYPRKKFTVRDGLPQSQVLNVVQHPDGHIWVVTKGGISKFDGKEFQSFGLQEGFHPDQYRQLYFTNDSTLFLGEQRYVAQWFLLDENRFVKCELKTSAGAKEKWRALPDMQGQLLFANVREPIDNSKNPIWVLQDSVLVRSKNHEFLAGKVSGVQDWAFEKRDSALWVCDNSGHLFRIKDGEVKHQYKFKQIGRSISAQFMNGPNGEFLAFVPDEHTLFRLEEHRVSVYKKLPQNKRLEQAEHRNTLAVDNAGNMFLVVDYNELWALFNGQTSWTFIDRFNWVTELFVDDENNVYVPDEGALYVFNNFSFSHFTPEEHGIPKYIWSIVENDQSQLWLGSYGHGLHIWNRENSSFRELTNTPTGYDGTNPLERIYPGANKISNGDVLIPASQSIYVFTSVGKLKKKLSIRNQPALMIYEDTLQQRIYAGTTAGVFVFDEDYNQIALFDDPMLTQRPVVSMAKDQYGNLWMGTWESIIKYDGQHFSRPFSSSEGQDISAKSMTTDRLGNLWFGSHTGLYYYNGKQLNEIEEALFKSVIPFVIELDEHRLLVGLVDGVAVIDLEKFFTKQPDWYSYFGEELGFTGIEPGQNAALRTMDGSVWIATTDQLTKMNPALLKNSSDNKVRVQVSSVEQFEKDIETGGQKQEIPIGENQDFFSIPYTTNRIRIKYKAINHTSPKDIQYQYRLLGFNDGWSPAYDERFAEYTNLGPGEYTFQVRAKHKSQPAPEQPAMASFSFTVPTPFYLSWWFFAIVILLGGAAVSYTTVVIVRNRKMKREQDDLLKLEMCQLQYRALKAQVEPHFASNLLNSVNAAILKEDKLQASRVLSHFAKLIRDILQHNDKMVYSLQEELDFIKLYIDLERNVLKDQLQYVVQIAPGVNLQRKIPVMLLHTFVENSIKHAIRPNQEGGLIQLNLTEKPSGLQVEISDTGSGNQPDTTLIKGAGKGVSLVDRIMEIHNRRNKQKMSIQIEDHNSGRKVLIYIPESFIFGSPEPMLN